MLCSFSLGPDNGGQWPGPDGMQGECAHDHTPARDQAEEVSGAGDEHGGCPDKGWNA